MSSYYNLKPSDFKRGVPAMKMKRGSVYCPNNRGYTDNILQAGLYDGEEAVKDCFDSTGYNGHCGVFAITLEMAMEQHFISKQRIKEYRERLDLFESLLPPDNYETTVF